jgi:nitronate monooxygenase
VGVVDVLRVPIVQAPMAGGPSTPALAAAVSGAGGLGFLAAGYRTADAVRADVAAVRALTDRPFGVNVFAPSGSAADPDAVARYAERLRPLARQAGVELGEPRFDDDGYAAKVAMLERERPAVVSFTFGCPAPDVVRRLREAGVAAWVTVTDVEEAAVAVAAGADALVVQGSEAGGHRGSFTDRDGHEDVGVLALLALVGDRVGVPLVAAGGIATGGAVAAVLAAGATAAALGTAFLRCPEAGTSAAHRAAVAGTGPTGLTRAFSGRLARGVVNGWQARFTADAPVAYPEVHHLTTPLRAHGRGTGDPELVNLWAGQAHALAPEIPAADLVAQLTRDALQAVERARARLDP